jgi:hypothetical protein
MGKYEPLTRLLESADSTSLRVSFREIETVLGFRLPESAHRYEAWWSNNEVGHSHARAWMAAGWRTEDLDLPGRKITFRRARSLENARKQRRKSDPWGCMAGTITLTEGADLTTPLGEEWNAEKGLLVNE